MNRGLFLILGSALAIGLPSAAASTGPASTSGLTIEPSVTCREGERAEFIRLSKARGDAIDGVFALCRNPAEPSEAWIARLERVRDRLIATAGDDAAKGAIRRAFAEHIARERAAD